MIKDNNEPEIINEEDSNEVDNKIKKIKEKLEACQKEKAEYLAGWQRSQADFINYKRRQEEQLAEWSKMFGAGLVADLLPVLDTLDASIKNGGDDGLKAMREQLFKVLQGHGLQEIKSVGEKFNPEWHEAIEAVAGEEPGVVVEEIQKGYILNGKVLRVVKVKVIK
ncbi:MAG: Protein GrpE [Parcubacteria group bacterium GW2011_GWC2_42_6]|nr:MAG: Protein GrpE [Parcubacteria group bacterium GW2011_GWC2_42_6]KKT76710.1 MAG: Protein GrpE [Parcubacteria group bacterium GW2011_GWF2_44_7]